MMKLFYTVLFFLAATNGHAQTLFTVAGNPVSQQEFMEAYHKNEPTAKPSDSALRAYLDLFINYKLKVHAARMEGLDTTAQQAADIKNYREQVILDHLKKSGAAKKILEEEIDHSGKEILAGHIFIPVDYRSDNDEQSAFQKINQAYDALKKGEAFEAVAKKYSGEPNVKDNKGIIGYVSALVLPYEIESVLFNTSKGKVSKPFQTKFGWHIVKNIDEKASDGTVSVAQILLAFPPSANAQEKEKTRTTAASLYAQLQNGADFEELAEKNSDDLLSRSNKGVIPYFSKGVYSEPFQQEAFALKEIGELSRPFESAYGYHILKLVGKKKPGTEEFNKDLEQDLQTADREYILLDAVAEEAKHKIRFKEGSVDAGQLDQFTRNVLKHPGSQAMQGLNGSSMLFSIEGKKYTVKDYRDHLVDMARSGNNVSQPASLFYKQYLNSLLLDYYMQHLEQYDEAFRQLMKDFSEGNLLFSAMNEHVWARAAADTNRLKQYYAQHKDNYWWNNSVDAILFSSWDEGQLLQMRGKLQDNAGNWRALVDEYAESIQADSGRFEIEQFPINIENVHVLPALTSIQKDEQGENHLMAYMIRLYKERSPREYKDAQGLVLTDYQNQLEKEWLAELKKKYPVAVNEKVFRSLL